MYLFKAGEIRKIGIDVTSRDNQAFTVDAADCRITYHGAEMEHGIPTIDGHRILLLFSATQVGRYQIELTYTIGPEKLKAQLYVEVD